jgi:hypothetical protein
MIRIRPANSHPPVETRKSLGAARNEWRRKGPRRLAFQANLVPSKATRQLGVRIDEQLVARLDLAAAKGRIEKTEFDTMRAIVEDALSRWLEARAF